jgi:DNA polymerase I
MDNLIAISPPIQVNDFVFVGLHDHTGELRHRGISIREYGNRFVELYSYNGNPVAVHGLKRILEWSGSRDWNCGTDPVYDVKLMAYLLDPDQEPRLNLLGQRYLRTDYPYSVPAVGDCGTDILPHLLAQDARFIYRLAKALRSQMNDALWSLYEDVELPLAPIMAQMHLEGVGVDGAACAAELKKIQQRIDGLYQEITEGESIDLSSQAETDRFLRSKGIGVPPGVPLEDFAFVPLVKNILEWRQLKQEDLSFLERAAGYNRVHPVWRQTRGATGRIYSAVVPVQSISKEKYRPLLKPDYSQIQLRLLAHLSGDKGTRETFLRGEDIYRATAQRLGITRDRAKAVNFGICFGQGAASLGADLAISQEHAQSYIDGFFAAYPGAQEFFGTTVNELKKKKRDERIITSPFGRIRRFPYKLTRPEERKIRITPLQQFEADIVKRAMVAIGSAFRERGMSSRTVLMIHDSIWVESPVEEADAASTIMTEAMTSVAKLHVPLEVKFE